jgi:ADP-heptose:LPS heptosyltransferase
MKEKNKILRQFVKKIILIRLDALGDLILSTPLLMAIRQNEPDWAIDALVTDYTKPVIENLPIIRELKVIQPQWGIPDSLPYFQSLAGETYDLSIAQSPTFYTYLASYLVKAINRIGIVYRERPLSAFAADSFLTNPISYEIRKKLASGERIPHEVEIGLDIARFLEMEVKSDDLYLTPGSNDERFAAATFTKWRWSKGDKIMAIHLSHKWMTHEFGIHNFRRIINDLQGIIPNLRVLFTFGPGERDLGLEFGKTFHEKESIKTLGEMTIFQWAALLKQCNLVLTADTAATHVASSQKVSTIVVYDPKDYEINSQQFAPWKVQNVKLKHGMPLRLAEQIVHSVKSLLGVG